MLGEARMSEGVLVLVVIVVGFFALIGFVFTVDFFIKALKGHTHWIGRL